MNTHKRAVHNSLENYLMSSDSLVGWRNKKKNLVQWRQICQDILQVSAIPNSDLILKLHKGHMYFDRKLNLEFH